MNIRFFTTVATVTLLSMTSGCCGLKDFMFGRGARCGLCQRLGAPLAAPAYAPQAPAYAPQAPCGSAPYAPAQSYAPTCSQPVASSPSGECGCNGYAYGGDSSYGSAYAGQCECGNTYGSTYGGVADPYLSSGEILMQGPVMGEQIVGEQIIGGTTTPGTVSPLPSGDWQARKVDTDGNKILWEEPLPSGAVAK